MKLNKLYSHPGPTGSPKQPSELCNRSRGTIAALPSCATLPGASFRKFLQKSISPKPGPLRNGHGAMSDTRKTPTTSKPYKAHNSPSKSGMGTVTTWRCWWRRFCFASGTRHSSRSSGGLAVSTFSPKRLFVDGGLFATPPKSVLRKFRKAIKFLISQDYPGRLTAW